MKKERSLRQGILIRFLIAALIPVLVFSIATQMNMVRQQKKNVEEQIRTNLHTCDQSLDIVLDKYVTVLYELCTDEEILETVERINQGENILEVNSNKLRHKLSHICNRTEGMVGVLFSLSGGKNIFYDGLNASSINSTWVEEIRVSEVETKEKYQGVTDPVPAGGENIYIFQIARNLVSYRDIHEKLGTVTISIREEKICEALNSGEDEQQNYLLDGSVILSALSKEQIGKNYGKFADLNANRYTRFLNETSGFTICNVLPMQSYNDSLRIQYLVMGIIACAATFMVFVATYLATKPYLGAVDEYVDAMNRLEKGDFNAHVNVKEGMAPELQSIINSFNDMVVHIENLIEQVKQASMEQKNAEMSALEAQIAPHFLYNTLDAINWKAIENEQYDISEMIGALADILRYTVKNAGGMTTLKQELEWLEHYIFLQSIKLGKKPELQIKVPEELMGIRIHKLLLQPFVENTMKYAFVNRDHDYHVVIRARMVDNQIHISIGDTGNGIETELLRRLNDESADMGEHVGIANVRKRLKLYYGEEAAVYFESILDSYTRVHLFIPLGAEEENQ